MDSIHLDTTSSYHHCLDQDEQKFNTLSTSSRKVLSKHLAPWQVIEVDALLTDSAAKLDDQQLDKAGLFVVDLAQSGVSYDVILNTLRELCKLMGEGQSYEQSVLGVTEQEGWLTPEAERIILLRFLSDVITPHCHHPDYRRQNAILDDMLRVFFKTIDGTLAERWKMIQSLLEGTDGLNFDDRAVIINLVVCYCKSTVSNRMVSNRLNELIVLKRIGLGSERLAEAVETLIQHMIEHGNRMFIEEHEMNIGGPMSAAAA